MKLRERVLMRNPARVFGLLVVASLLIPAAAAAAVDPDSVTSTAEVEATATDGGGGSSDTDRSGLAGFLEFLRAVDARDFNSDSGREGRAEVLQDTLIIEDGDDVLGVDSSGSVVAAFDDPDPKDSSAPSSSGTSELEIGFDVVGDPVKYSLTGKVDVGAPPQNATCSRASVLVDGNGSEIEMGPGCSGPDFESFDLTGTLNPGAHTLAADLSAVADGGSGGSTVTALYELELRFCTIVASQPGQATLGTSGDDVICGRSGDEQLIGVGGNDRIFGLGGVDDISGGDGDDEIDGGAGDDLQLYGGPGDDTIDGGPGDDGHGQEQEVMAGGPGDDEMDGGPGDDLIYGRCGEALLGTPSPACNLDPPVPGEFDDDNLMGGSGGDSLFGDAGTNFLNGGRDEDILIGGVLDDTILGGDGPDAASGGFGNDRIEGGAQNDSIDGNRGNDDLFGGGGSDTMRGFQGGDCLVGGPGGDVFEGNQGNDTLLAKDGGRDTGNGGPEPDRGRFDGSDQIGSVTARNFQGGC